MSPKIELEMNEEYFMFRSRAVEEGLPIMRNCDVEFVRIDGENYRLKSFVPSLPGLIPYFKSIR